MRAGRPFRWIRWRHDPWRGAVAEARRWLRRESRGDWGAWHYLPVNPLDDESGAPNRTKCGEPFSEEIALLLRRVKTWNAGLIQRLGSIRWKHDPWKGSGRHRLYDYEVELAYLSPPARKRTPRGTQKVCSRCEALRDGESPDPGE